jgi:hypothetical protein
MKIISTIVLLTITIHTILFFSFGCASTQKTIKSASASKPFIATKIGDGCGHYAPKIVELGGTTPWSGIVELFDGNCSFDCDDDEFTIKLECDGPWGIHASFVGNDSPTQKYTNISVVYPLGSCETKYEIVQR